MGSFVEINDTLQITKEQGFPSDIFDLERHRQRPVTLNDVENKFFTFRKPGRRIFHLDPVRVFLVQNVEGKWLFWGKVLIQSLTISRISGGNDPAAEAAWETSGQYRIIDIYEPLYQEQCSMRESPGGKSFF